MSQPVQDATIALLGRTLGRVASETSIVASNLANVDTPGYRAMQVVFRDVLRDAQGGLGPLRTDPAHLGAAHPDGKGKLVEAPVTRIRMDGNTVDVDGEMTRFATLQGRYNATAEMLKKRFGLLEYAVTTGGGR